MPHKEGHWGYKTRKKAQKSVQNLAGKGYKKATGHGWRSDKNPVQQNLNKRAGVADERTAGGRIQKDLVKGGWSKTELRHKMEEHARKQKAKADMKKLKKTNPEEYKKRKKARLKKERLKAFTAGSHTWD